MQPTSHPCTPQQMRGYMEHFKTQCRQHRLRLTRQRTEVYRALVLSMVHPGAEAVFDTVRRALPNISLDTVYRTLASLEEAGLVVRVGVSNQARYDAHTEPHYHFVCMNCGEVYDIFLPPGQEVAAATDEVKKFGKVVTVNLQFRGVCTRCLQTAPEA